MEIAADEARAEIERKQQEFELRRKQREMELELATQKEAMEMAEMNRQKKLSVKMEKMEIMDEVSSRSTVSSSSWSVQFRQGKTSSWINSQENKFDSHLEETLDDKPSFSKFDEPPSSSMQLDAKMQDRSRVRYLWMGSPRSHWSLMQLSLYPVMLTLGCESSIVSARALLYLTLGFNTCNAALCISVFEVA